MSKEFEQLKYMIDPESDEDKKEKWTKEQKLKEVKKFEENRKKIEEWEHLKKDKIVLENSGVLSLFEEIRDSGLVKYDDDPVIKQTAVYKETFFKGRFLDHYEKKKISDYIPALVIQYEPHYDDVTHEWCGVTGIELRFNGSSGWYLKEHPENNVNYEDYSKVEIIVENEKLQILKTNGNYELVEKDNIISAISQGIKKPYKEHNE